MSLYEELTGIADELALSINVKSREYLEAVLEKAATNWKNGSKCYRYLDLAFTMKEGIPSISELNKFLYELEAQGFKVKHLSASIETATYRISF